MHVSNDALRHRFAYHKPNTENKVDAHQMVRQVCLEAATAIVESTGAESREQSLAITKLEEAMFWANAAIARGDGPRAPLS